MLEEHDRWALAISKQVPYARHIPIYPELPPDKSQINHTAQAIPHSRSPQGATPMYHGLLGERHKVQEDQNLGPHWGARVGVEVPLILRSKEFAPHVDPILFTESRNGVRSLGQPVDHVEMVCPHGPARDVWLDDRPAIDPILQNQFTGYNRMVRPHFMHEPPASLVVPVPVPVPIVEKVSH
jgi:hypothetical protein